MQSTLLNTLTGWIDRQTLGAAATQLREPEQSVSRGFQSSFATILGGLAGKTSNSGFMRQAFDVITSPANDDHVLDNPAGLVSTTAFGGPATEMGKRFMGTLFGSNEMSVFDAVGRWSGLRTQSVTSIMSMAAPIVLAMLGRKIRTSGLNQSSFTRLLDGEAAGLSAALPSSLAASLGLGALPATRVAEVAPESRASSEMRWLAPTLAVLAVLGAGIWVANRIGRRTVSDVASRASSAMSGAAERAATLASTLGDFIERKLPN